MKPDAARAATASQTVGPFFHLGLKSPAGEATIGPGSDAERVRIAVSVVDGDGRPVDDALLEVWHLAAGSGGVEPAAHYGRWPTDKDGGCEFETVRPAGTPDGRGGWQAPHINVAVFARGLLDHLTTRLYFEDDPATRHDPVLQRVPEARRRTLLARRLPGEGRPVYRFDIVLQGPDETVFFEF